MLTMKDLDFDLRSPDSLMEREREDAQRDIRESRKKLGQFSVRDTVEAVYGTEYAQQMLGDEGGKDILMEELTVSSDLREQAGLDRTDVGGNRLPTNKPDGTDISNTVDALSEQERVAEEAIEESVNNYYTQDAALYRKQDIAKSINEMLPEEKEEIIRLLLEQTGDNR